ncbi:MAG TPA: AAA family ATPase [Catenuloplanes sp.]|jgi:predicted kinase
MPVLILLNGPPAAGKTTLARMYVDRHPLALNLDIDLIRGQLGGWRDDPGTAGLAARAIALAAARTHLSQGHDVVIPQLLCRPDFIEQVERLAHEVGARFHEIVLLDSRENSLRRFTERSRAAAEPAHTQAQELLDHLGGLDELAAMYDRLLAVIADRPTAKIVRTEEGKVAQAYRDLVASLRDEPPPT